MRSARVALARTSEPPCFSVMPMPSSTPDFSCAGRNVDRKRKRECAAPIPLPTLAQHAGLQQRKTSWKSGRCVRLHLGSQHHQRGTRNVSAGALRRSCGGGSRIRFPGQAVQPVRDGGPHQVVPGRMKDDFVSTVAVTIVRVQDGLVLIGFKAPALRFFRAQKTPKLGDLLRASLLLRAPRIAPACDRSRRGCSP